MKRFILSTFLFILAFGTIACAVVAQSSVFLTTSSPNKTYVVEFTGNKHAPSVPGVNHEVRFNLFKNDHLLVKNAYVDEYDWFDSDFAGMYSEYKWLNDSVLRIGSGVSKSEKSVDSLVVSNKTNKTVKYLRIVAGDMLFVFEMPPTSTSKFSVPYLGELPWVAGEGEFADGQKIKWNGVNFQNKEKRKDSLRYCMSIDENSLKIESPLMNGYNGDGTSETPNILKAISCD